jgi:hypothetical protein
MRQAISRAIKAVDARDVAFLGGLGLLSFGAWLAYEPAGFIVPGVVFFALSLLGARR